MSRSKVAYVPFADAGLASYGRSRPRPSTAGDGGTGGASSTALEFPKAMNAAGYLTVKVYGYTESLMVDSEGSKRGETGARAQDICVVFPRVGTGAYRNL